MGDELLDAALARADRYGHKPGCYPDPDRDPYVGCVCGETRREDLRRDVRALVERVREAEAERDRLKRGGATLGKALDDALWDIAEATRSTGLLDETRDGDWGLIFERLATLGDRAEKSEAERDEARGKLDAVRAWLDDVYDDGTEWRDLRRLRAIIDAKGSTRPQDATEG